MICYTIGHPLYCELYCTIATKVLLHDSTPRCPALELERSAHPLFFEWVKDPASCHIRLGFWEWNIECGVQGFSVKGLGCRVSGFAV